LGVNIDRSRQGEVRGKKKRTVGTKKFKLEKEREKGNLNYAVRCEKRALMLEDREPGNLDCDPVKPFEFERTR